MNTNGIFFKDTTQQSIVDKQKQELYMQLYPFIAEDFLSSMDAKTYSDVMEVHIQNIQTQLEKLFNLISNHTHPIQPHIHIAPSSGGPTSPASLVTQLCTGSAKISWIKSKTPITQNTTGSIWNIKGNFVIEGLPSDGMAIVGKRRASPLPLTISLVLPPILNASFKGNT